MILTGELINSAALVLVVDENGSYDFTSTRTPLEVAAQLVRIADQIQRRQKNGGLILP